MSTATTLKKVAVLAIVVGNNDEPVFLKDLKAPAAHLGSGELHPDEYLYHFLLHSSLDLLADKQWVNTNMFLGVVETFREYSVSAWITLSGTKLLLLHHGHTELQVKNFFREVHQVWIKQAMNPLQPREGQITSLGFDVKVTGLATRHLI
ncbi:hypothetical protein BASA81_006653 [Batrachochytrium salamandrivorans]|nr:hypothetical protein BASA81_006653 [Batrachochytrium salamandrivorans]